MKRSAIFIVLLFLASLAVISCESKTERLAKAKELLNKRCSKCHFSDKVYQKKYTKEDWKKTIDRMVNLSKESNRKEVEISHEDAFEILNFLQEESGD